MPGLRQADEQVQVLELLCCVDCGNFLPKSAFDTVEPWPGYTRHLYRCRFCMSLD